MSCCKEYAQSISEYLDGALNKEEQQLLLEHMEGCEGCRAYLAELAAMHDALAELPEVELPEGFHASVMEKVRAKRHAKKTLLWKRYATIAACAALVFLGASRLMPDFRAGSAAPETADMAMESGWAAEEEAPMAALGASQRASDADAVESKTENFSYILDDTETAEPQEAPVAETEALARPVVRGENARETLLALGAQDEGDLLRVPTEVLKNLPEGLVLDGEFDANEEFALVLIKEVTS